MTPTTRGASASAGAGTPLRQALDLDALRLVQVLLAAKEGRSRTRTEASRQDGRQNESRRRHRPMPLLAACTKGLPRLADGVLRSSRPVVGGRPMLATRAQTTSPRQHGRRAHGQSHAKKAPGVGEAGHRLAAVCPFLATSSFEVEPPQPTRFHRAAESPRETVGSATQANPKCQSKLSQIKPKEDETKCRKCCTATITSGQCNPPQVQVRNQNCDSARRDARVARG